MRNAKRRIYSNRAEAVRILIHTRHISTRRIVHILLTCRIQNEELICIFHTLTVRIAVIVIIFLTSFRQCCVVFNLILVAGTINIYLFYFIYLFIFRLRHFRYKNSYPDFAALSNEPESQG